MRVRALAVRIGRLALCVGFAMATLAHAAPEEIQVYQDDLTQPGHFGLDLHQNYAVAGLTSLDYVGERAPDHVYRLTPEFYYGLTPDIELGAYLLTSLDRGGRYAVDGEKFRIKYIVPHAESSGSFWGVNLEVGKSDHLIEQRPWNYELKGIYGWRDGPWILGINLNLDASMSAHPGPTTIDVDSKLNYALTHATQVGLELYDGLGPVSSPGHLNQQSQTAYAVLDADLGVCDLNVGVGRGLSTASDRWVLKMILGFHF